MLFFKLAVNLVREDTARGVSGYGFLRYRKSL